MRDSASSSSQNSVELPSLPSHARIQLLALFKKKVAVLSVFWKRFKRGPHFHRRFKNIATKGGDSVDISRPGLIKQPAPKFSCFKDSTLPAKIM